MPLFSIITVCYNETGNIKKTLDSIIEQSFRDFELIVVDGGSTDGTKEIVQQYEQNIAWWCSERDYGIYNAMNKGVSHATGEYVIFMNAGDWFYNKHVLENVHDKKQNTDVIEGYVVVSNKNVRLREKYEDLYVHLFTDTLSHQGAFIKRTLLLSHPYDEKYKIVADWKFWLEALILEGRSFSFIELDIAYYDTTGISSKPEIVAKEREMVFKELFPPHIIKLIHSYYDAYHLPLVRYAVYLNQHSHKSYELVRKFTKRLVKIVKRFHSLS